MAETTSADEERSEAEAYEQPEEEEEVESADLTTERGGFHCVVEQHVLFDFFETFSTIVDEIKLHIDDGGFYGAAVDPANVAMVEEELGEGAFEHYSSTGGLIGVNVARFHDILSLGDDDDLVELELDQETRKLHVEIDGLEYTLALIDPDSIRQEPDIPELELSSEIVLEGDRIYRGVKAADMVSDHIRLSVDPATETFNIEAAGDTDDVDLELGRDDLIDLQVGEADSLFSLDYLKDLKNAFGKDTEITIELGDEYPVKLHFEHIEADGETHGSVTMMLAPRIQSD